VNGHNHLLIDRQINVVIIAVSKLSSGARPFGPSTNGRGPLLENGIAIMTASAALRTGGRSLRFGPPLMHMNTKLLAGRTLLKLLNLFLT
jgi:hypothetical protein